MNKVWVLLFLSLLIFGKLKATICGAKYNGIEFCMNEFDDHDIVTLVEIDGVISFCNVCSRSEVMPEFSLKIHSCHPQGDWNSRHFASEDNYYWVKTIKTYKGNTDSLKFIAHSLRGSGDGVPLNIGGKYIVYEASKESAPLIIPYGNCKRLIQCKVNPNDRFNKDYFSLGSFYVAQKAKPCLEILSMIDTIQNGKVEFFFENHGDSTRKYLSFKGEFKNGKRHGGWKINTPSVRRNWKEEEPGYILKYEKGLYKEGKKIGVWLISEWDWKTKKWVRREEVF